VIHVADGCVHAYENGRAAAIPIALSPRPGVPPKPRAGVVAIALLVVDLRR